MPYQIPKNEKIYLFVPDDEDFESNRLNIDWNPLPCSANFVEYLLAKTTLVKVDRLMTTAWNLKTLYLALHPDHKTKSWIIELGTAMRFADKLFPPEEEQGWRK